MSKFPKALTATALVVGMALGSVFTLALNPLGAASALVGASSPAKGSHQGVLQQALDTLVGNGTISKSQADAVTNQVHDNRAQRLAKRPVLRRGVLNEVAAKFKMNPKDLLAELRGGKSLADVAKEKGIDPGVLANEIVAGLDAKIDGAVSKHHLKADAANTMKQALPGRVEAFLNRKWPTATKHPNHQAPAATPAAPSTTAPSSTAPATTAPSTSAPTTSNGSTTTTHG